MDRELTVRAVSNLLRNAAEAGAFAVWVQEGYLDRRVVLWIRDNGPGLLPGAQKNLFQPFSGSARAGGTGLGLPIARELMRGQGGDLVLGWTG
ncbi:MAG: putative two-component sensor histidine kinase [Rhodospirillaceae bacterium]|nr:MAG: putative two-component sensor histidine kinase [Rhodospirillaceae bacterium]